MKDQIERLSEEATEMKESLDLKNSEIIVLKKGKILKVDLLELYNGNREGLKKFLTQAENYIR